MFDNNNFQIRPELNSAMKQNPITEKKGVEIFSAMCAGNDLSKYDGKTVDAIDKHIKELGQGANAGNVAAMAELNNIRTEMIETPLMQRINLFNFMGDVIKVGETDEIRYKQYTIEGEAARQQAANATFPFATYNFTTKVMDTQFITAGVVMDYYNYAVGNYDMIQAMNENAVNEMMNKMFYVVSKTLYSSIKGAPIKNFSEAAGITKTAVDNALRIARRFGKVNIMGDYNVVSQMTGFAGFDTNTTTKMFSQKIMDEINATGLIHSYNGANVVEIPNTFNFNKMNKDKSFYETYLPEGLLYFTVAGENSPLKIGIRGGLKSMAGQDIYTAKNLQRYDLAFGVVSLLDKPGYAGTIGLVSDSNYSVDK